MKKIMMAVAIVCAAAMSQAATTKWTATTGSNVIYTAGGEGTFSGTAYLFCLSTADTATKATIYSQQDILDAFLAKTDISTLAYQKDLTVTDGKIASTSFTSEDFATGKATKFFLAVVKDDEIYISGMAQKTSNATTPQALSFNPTASSAGAALQTETYGSAGWYQAVPEPTSALLLLLGMAGLALKRKQA